MAADNNSKKSRNGKNRYGSGRSGSGGSSRKERNQSGASRLRSKTPESEKRSGYTVKKQNGAAGNGIFVRAATVLFTALISVMLFFQDLYNKIKNINLNDGRFKKRIYYIAGASIVFVIVASVVFVVWFNTNINAQEVYLNGQLIGTIKDKELTAEKIFGEAKLKRQTDHGVPIESEDKVTTKLVHAKKTDELDYVIGKIYNQLTYQVQAVCISVDGMEIIVLKSRVDADSVLDDILNEYMQEGLQIISKEFVEDVVITDKYVFESEISLNEIATEMLTSNRSEKIEYKAQSGDSYWKIANNADMTLDELFEMNPDLDPNPAKLKPGILITISRSVPFLSVRTKERFQYEEVIKMPVQTVSNDAQPKTYSKVMQQGRDGRKSITEDIIRVNGYEIGREFVESTIIDDAVAQITEVGTK